MQSKLRKCPCCKEWFNTTTQVMMRHYQTKHDPQFRKFFALAELYIKLARFKAQAEFAPWPLSMQYSLSAITTEHQIQAVLSTEAK